MNKLKKRSVIIFCFLVILISAVTAYAGTWSELATDSGRAQWQGGGGYCGSLAIQKIMLKYGIWISQQEARSAGGGELLLGINYGDALDNLKIEHKTYTNLRADASTHLQRIRSALMAGRDYVIGARTNLFWGGDSTYDHIFAVHAMSGASTGYSGSNYIYFNDSYPVGLGAPDMTEKSCTWEEFTGEDNGCEYFFDNRGQWGEEIIGVPGWSEQVTLSVDLVKEPGEPLGSTSSMFGNVHLSGLTKGNRYTIKKWEGTWKNYDGFSSNFSDFYTFTAETTTYDCRVSWIGGNIAIFDIEDNGEDDIAENLQTWSNQSITSGYWEFYTFDVPSGASLLTVETNGGQGDADLYIRHGSYPTASTFDCRSWDYGNNERCEERSLRPGTWYIGVYAYPDSGNVSGLTVTAEHE